MAKATPAAKSTAPTKETQPSGQSKDNGQAPNQAPERVISDPNEVAQLVMMRIDHVNSKKGELTIAVKALADTAKQLVACMPNNRHSLPCFPSRWKSLRSLRTDFGT